jgi:hypothetical protein
MQNLWKWKMRKYIYTKNKYLKKSPYSICVQIMKHHFYPVLAQLVEHLTVEVCY